MSSYVAIIGTVTEIIYDKSSSYKTICYLYLQNERKKVKYHYLQDIPLHEGDTIKALCEKLLDEYYGKILPAVMMFDQRSLFIAAWKRLFRREKKVVVEKLYDDLVIKCDSTDISNYMNDYASRYYEERDGTMLEGFSPFLTNPKNVKRLLIWWYKERLQRALRLLFWTREQMNYFKCSLLSMREFCLENPFCCFFLSEEQCIEILTMQEIPGISKKAKALSQITRFIYQQVIKKGWSCVPKTQILKQFSYYQEFYDELCEKYFVVEDLDCVYLQPMHDKEKLCAVLLDTLVQKNTLPVTSAWHNPQNLEFPELYSYDQRKAIIGALEHPVSIISGGAGVGKCLGFNTPVLMFDGQVKMVQDLQVGEYLKGPDKNPRKILSLTTGYDTLYRVIPTWGDSFVCNGDHILSLINRRPEVINKRRQVTIKYFIRGNKAYKIIRNREEERKFLAKLDKNSRFNVTVRDFIAWPRKRQNCTLINTACFIDFPERKSVLEQEDGMSLRRIAVNLAQLYLDKKDFSCFYLFPALVRSTAVRRREFLHTFIDEAELKNKIYLPLCPFREQFVFLLKSCHFTVDQSSAEYVRFEKKIFSQNLLKVVKHEPGPYYGFTISGNGLFLLGDFTVTHNTTCIGAITNYLHEKKVAHMVASFTGKAVARVKEAVHPKTQCMTLDLMIYKPDLHFTHLIIDEASMVCVDLLGRFLQRFPQVEKITFVGDVNQLPPINWGAIFQQMISSKVFPTYYLTTNFRVYHSDYQDGILINANNMLRDSFSFTPTPNFFLKTNGLQDIKKILEACHRDGVALENLMILSPYNKDLGDLNHLFSQIYNKKNSKESLLDKFRQPWSTGDRIMITENNQTLNCFNGQIGYIKQIKKEKDAFDIQLQEDNMMPVYLKEPEYDEYDEDDKQQLTLKMLKKAYCLTIDKSQGSEWDFVILYISKFCAGDFINKQRIYTAITRAKRACWIVTENESTALNQAACRKLGYRCDRFNQHFTNLPTLEPLIIKKHEPWTMEESTVEEE